MQTKTAFITLFGRPNVGKSTLLNALLGCKVSIVSPKPQTTRQKVTGILSEGDTQLIFADTPGVHHAKNKLGNFMDEVVGESAAGADVAVLVVASGDEIRENEKKMLSMLKGHRAVLVINKIDLYPKEEILKTITAFSKAYDFDEIVPVSAYKKDGITLLKDLLKGFAVPAPFFYDEQSVTDMSETEMICEAAREKMLYLLGDEIPHGVAVHLEYLEKTQSTVRVGLSIICERDSHKGIIIGKNGRMISKINAAVRKELEFMYDTKIFLESFVKVKPNWRNDAAMLKDFGFTK